MKQLIPHQKAIEMLKEGNKRYVTQGVIGDISKNRRQNTAENGQKPYVVILSCSDSRAAPEHIFSAGTGDIFVIRTAGNVVGNFELGSIEYAVLHLGVSLVTVLGHNNCGAVAAAIEGHAEGHINSIVEEVKSAITGITNSTEAEDLNIRNSLKRILESEDIAKLVHTGDVLVTGAKYNIMTGEVRFF